VEKQPQRKPVIKRRSKRRRVCAYCVDKAVVLDYKEVSKFRKFITERGKIYPRRNSGVCAKHQRMLAEAVKRARFIALIPFCVD
jgi:small subunit ribosomal protein S18